jgi:hypothetical protein
MVRVGEFCKLGSTPHNRVYDSGGVQLVLVEHVLYAHADTYSVLFSFKAVNRSGVPGRIVCEEGTLVVAGQKYAANTFLDHQKVPMVHAELHPEQEREFFMVVKTPKFATGKFFYPVEGDTQDVEIVWVEDAPAQASRKQRAKR